ncbi:hypothetical protein ScPMuIL_014862 [Solemya velum]
MRWFGGNCEYERADRILFQGCKLVNVTETRCGTCSQTLVESCDDQTQKEDTGTSLDVVIGLSVVTGSAGVAASLYLKRNLTEGFNHN